MRGWDVIDEEHLAQQTAGDAALRDELLNLLLQQLDGLRKVLNGSGCAPADLPQVLHRIRGAAAAVGAWTLAESFLRAEQDLGRRLLPPKLLDDLRTELDHACMTLAGLIAARTPAGLANAGESR